MYSHFASGLYGKTMPPQNNFKAPWFDEVQQSVSIALQLNQNLRNPQYCPGPNKEVQRNARSITYIMLERTRRMVITPPSLSSHRPS